jgi:hypothetical protein
MFQMRRQRRGGPVTVDGFMFLNIPEKLPKSLLHNVPA